MTILLKNGNVTDSLNNLEGVLDVLIRDGEICSVCADIDQPADKIIDCSGLAVIPGICDMHVHLRDPGQTHKEDLASGSMAAAAGGVTAVMCMPNTSPVIDTPALVRDIAVRSKAAKVKIYPCASITKGLLGQELTDFHALKAAGAVAVSDDGHPVEDSALMAKAMKLAHEAGLAIISHCEDLSVTDTRMSENLMTEREINLANDLKLPVHIAHVSTNEAVSAIIAAKAAGLGSLVTCEVAPHHFTLTEAELLKGDADYRMNPPLRGAGDVRALIEGLSDGEFDCIASDHAPHAKFEKADFENAPNGVLGLETILAVTLTRLYHTGKLPFKKIVELLCVNPRRILGISGGGLCAGSLADIAVVDLEEEWVVIPEELHSKSKNTCFKGMTLKGRVKYTLVDGEVVYNGIRQAY